MFSGYCRLSYIPLLLFLCLVVKCFQCKTLPLATYLHFVLSDSFVAGVVHGHMLDNMLATSVDNNTDMLFDTGNSKDIVRTLSIPPYRYIDMLIDTRTF